VGTREGLQLEGDDNLRSSGAGALSGAPQASQKRAPARLSAPHLVHSGTRQGYDGHAAASNAAQASTATSVNPRAAEER
jgi:hypothetical protein